MYSIFMSFPSPAEGYTDVAVDFNRHILEHPAASYCFYVKGDSMAGAHIAEGDMVVVDRSLTPVSGSLIVCSLDGAFTLKRFEIRSGKNFLVSANINYEPVEITSESDFSCWGVAVALVRKFSQGKKR
jgi:DNA polymerase V